MSIKGNDWPAFPQPTARTNDDGTHHMRGLTMRDYFAAKALAGMAQHFPVDGESAKDCAVACYRFADAMLKRRDE